MNAEICAISHGASGRLFEAGLAGMPWWEAPELAESLLDDPTDAAAYDLLIAAHRDGLIRRAKAAVANHIAGLTPTYETASPNGYLEVAFDPVDIDVEALIGAAARASDLDAETIIEIVAEAAPEAVALETAISLKRYARMAIADFQRTPARQRDPLPDVDDATFLRDIIEPMQARSVTPPPELVGLAERARNPTLRTMPLSPYLSVFFPAYLASEHRASALQRNVDARAAWKAGHSARSEPVVAAFDLGSEPGLLGDIARWSQVYAFKPVKEFAQPAALAVLATIFGRRWATPTGLGLNLYLVAIADTGGGKDALLGAPKALLSAANFRHLLGPGDFTSDAAIELALRSRPSQLMPLDEFGKLAQAMMGRNAPSFAKLAAKALLEIYPRSAPGSEWTGKQRASDERDNAADPVFSPTLSLLAVSTPTGFFEGMSQQTLDDGFLNRLTVISATKAGDRQRDPARLTPPAPLVKALQSAYEASRPGGNLAAASSRIASAAPEIRFATWADDAALAALEEVEAWEDAALDAGRQGVTGRTGEQTQKIATLRALSRDPSGPQVSAEDIRWAFAMVRASIDAIETGARDKMAGSEFEGLVKAIERACIEAGPTGLPWSKLGEKKGVAQHTPQMVDAAVKRLEQTETIAVGIMSGAQGGRPGKRVRATVFDV